MKERKNKIVIGDFFAHDERKNRLFNLNMYNSSR